MTNPGFSTTSAEEFTALLSGLGGVLLSHETLETTVKLVTQLASETIPATTGAGVTLIDLRGRRSTAATDTLVEQADRLQYELDTGPCMAAWRDRVIVRIEDIDVETRWPQWTAAVAQHGIRSVLSVPLVAGESAVGAMKVYSRQPGAYDDRAQHLLELFARQAAILLSNTLTLADAQEAHRNVTAALEYRDIIGQAKGILIAQGAPHADAAFAMLVSASQRSNMRLHDVARQLVTSVRNRNTDRPIT